MIDYEKIFSEFEHESNVDLRNLSTMKVGGIGKVLIYPKNIENLKKICKKCKKNSIKMLILGNGSNILFSDDGFDGVIVKLKHFQKFKIIQSPVFRQNNCLNIHKKKQILYKKYYFKNKLNYEKCKKIQEKAIKKRKKFAKNIFLIEIGAGMNLFSLNLKLKDVCASGLEFSYGIPATLGGFLKMNGGCFGHEICEFVDSVQVLQNGKVFWLRRKQIDFSYRNSNLNNAIILGARLRFFHKKSEDIEKNMFKFLSIKRKTQPCNLPSLGSVFKRCGNFSPAKIIDNFGLKGKTIGGAQVSTLHAGFIVNVANATSADVLSLVHFLQDELQKVGCPAKPEIEFAE